MCISNLEWLEGCAQDFAALIAKLPVRENPPNEDAWCWEITRAYKEDLSRGQLEKLCELLYFRIKSMSDAQGDFDVYFDERPDR